MKNYKFLIIIVLFFFEFAYCFSQSNEIVWQKCYGGSLYEPSKYSQHSIQKTKDGGMILFSTTESNDGDIPGNVTNGLCQNFGMSGLLWIVKLDVEGNILWQTFLGGEYCQTGYSITETSDSCFLVIGNTVGQISTNVLPGYHGNSDIILTKINRNGNILWNKCIGGSGFDFIQQPGLNYINRTYFLETTNLDYLIGFDTNSSDGDLTNNYGGTDICLMVINSQGVILNQKSFGGSSVDNLFSISQCTDNSGFIILGMSRSNNGIFSDNNGNSDINVLKVDNSLNLVWSKSLGSSENDRPFNLIHESNGRLIVSGRLKELNSDFVIYKLDSSGSIIQSKTFGGSSDDVGNQSSIIDEPKLYKKSNNEYFIKSYTNSIDGDVLANYGGYDFWIVKIDSNFNILWDKTFGSIIDETISTNLIFHSNNDITFGIEVTSNSGNLSNPNFHGSINNFTSDIGIVKLNSNGDLIYYNCFGGSEEEHPGNIVLNEITNDILFCGSTFSNDGNVSGNHGQFDIWMAKLNSNLGLDLISPMNKKLVKIYDLMSRETNIKSNEVLFYQYSDGSVEKKLIIE